MSCDGVDIHLNLFDFIKQLVEFLFHFFESLLPRFFLFFLFIGPIHHTLYIILSYYNLVIIVGFFFLRVLSFNLPVTPPRFDDMDLALWNFC